MKKKYIIGVFLGLILILGSGIFYVLYENNVNNENDNTKVQVEAADAYFEVFRDLYETSGSLNQDKYIVIDLTKIKMADYSALIKLMEEFCENHDKELLQDTHEGLVEKGFIKDLYFEEGIVVTFEDSKLNKSVLKTSAKIWKSGLGAVGADYTVKFKNDSWEITKTTNTWIS